MDKDLTAQKPIFESIKKISKDNKEYWLARELMPHLGYETWESFHKVIKRAMISLLKSYPHVTEHFRETTKKIKLAPGSSKEATRDILDYKLTRYACYLIAQNGDPKKDEIAHAQAYFATKTRKQEITEERNRAVERIVARRKLKETEKKFTDILIEHGVESRQIPAVRSAGDEALFNMSTREIKSKLGVKYSKPLADHLPTITLKAKDLATEITTFNARTKNLQGKEEIKVDHIDNNSAVRQLLNERGIYPEKLPAEEDVRRLESRITEDEIKRLKTNDFIDMEEIFIDIRGIGDEKELNTVRTAIEENPGSTKLKIIYGSKFNPKQIVRDIEVNSSSVNVIKKYIVLN